MSTLLDGRDPTSSEGPIRGREDLLAVFRVGEKPHGRHGIGIEYERLPVSRETGSVIPYATKDVRSPSIERFLERLAGDRGWTPRREDGHIIALERNDVLVTLEPGAQVELSGSVHQDLDAARDEIRGFVRESDEIAASMGIAFLGVGYHPFTDFTEIGWVPKARYRIMAPYLVRRGHLAHGMMKGTAGCQVNLDYSSEADAMNKLRVATGVSSLVTALCANSPLSRGGASGFLSKRSHIWLHTDPDRTGLLPLAFRDGFGYADYAEYALDVPMFFVVRAGRWIDMTDRTFRSFIDGNDSGLTPAVADWVLHLTTLFPEVRLKAYLEVRGSDSDAPEMILAQAALWKGLLYDDEARRSAWELVGGATMEQRLTFHRDMVRTGLRATMSGRRGIDLARELLGIAQRGLPPSERPYLEPLLSLLTVDGCTRAEILLRRWSGEWGHDPRRLVESLAPDPTLRPA